MISLTNHDSSEGEQWGRSNLPRSHGWSPSALRHSRLSWPRIRWTRPFNQPNGTWINTAEESDLPKVFRTSLCTQRTRSGKGSGKSKSCGKGLQGQEFHGMYQTWITFRKTGKHRNIMRHPKRSFERWNLRKGNLLTHADSAEDHPSG